MQLKSQTKKNEIEVQAKIKRTQIKIWIYNDIEKKKRKHLNFFFRVTKSKMLKIIKRIFYQTRKEEFWT